ncbi:MAG: carbohydrate ABC transporter permease [Betaproteobacteria bacterium]
MRVSTYPGKIIGTGKLRPTRVNWTPVILIGPSLILFAVLLLFPILRGLMLSFCDAALLTPPGAEEFVGLRNYARLFSDPAFWSSLRVTVIYTFWVVIGAYVIGLATALLLHPRFCGRTIFRLLTFLPWAVPEVVAVLVWRWMLDYQYGVVNFFLRTLGVISANQGWLTVPQLALPAVIAVTVWKQFPLATLMLLAGLQAIPEHLYEAARIDGANRYQEFWHVTLPGLRPVNIVLVLLMVLYSFKRVTLVYVLTGGGPAAATETLSIQTYLQAFKFFQVGYGSAIGSSMFLLMLAFTIAYFIVLSRRGEE